MIEITPLYDRDLSRLAALWSEALVRLGFACALSEKDIEEHVLLHGGEPRAILAIDPKGWLAARQEDALVGFVHCTVGRLETDEPETLRGVVRALVTAPDAPPATAGLLLKAADVYFDGKRNLDGIIAFDLATGYPRVAYGRGAILGEDWRLMEALGQRGFKLARRWLFFERHVRAPIPEHLPQLPGMTLFWQDSMDDHLSLVVRLGSDEIASIRFIRYPQPDDCSEPLSAGLHRLDVRPERQGQGVGRWLLERGINHLVAHGVRRLFVDIPHEDGTSQSRLMRMGFHEAPLRGYSYERAST